jgi:hypothetical protein
MGYHASVRSSLPAHRTPWVRAWRLRVPGSSVRRTRMETSGSHTFPGDPLCLCPALRPRQDRRRQAIAASRLGPRRTNNEGSCIEAFEALSHGFSTRCLRFTTPVTRTPRKARFRPLARCYRAGLATHRVPAKGFRSSTCYVSSPFPELRVAIILPIPSPYSITWRLGNAALERLGACPEKLGCAAAAPRALVVSGAQPARGAFVVRASSLHTKAGRMPAPLKIVGPS